MSTLHPAKGRGFRFTFRLPRKQRTVCITRRDDTSLNLNSPYINRFLQPDTVILDLSNPQGWNRFSYVGNRPLSFNDPTGHKQSCADGDEGGECGYGANTEQIYEFFSKHGRHKWFAAYYAKLHQLTLAQSRNDPNLPDYAAAVAAEKQVAEAWLPQKDFNVIDVVGPNDIYGAAKALVDFGGEFVSGGVGAISALLPAPKGSRGNYLSPYGFPDLKTEPSDGFQWKGNSKNPGSPEGSWYNESTNEYLRYDPSHHGTPHIDYRSPDGIEFWIWPDGSMTPKH